MSMIKLPDLPPVPSEKVIFNRAGFSTNAGQDEDALRAWATAYAEQAVREALAAQEPLAWRYRTNGTHINYSDVEPPSDAYDELTLCRLALIPENSHGKPT